MEIKYIGHSSFLIKTKEARVVTDPFDPKVVGLKFPKTEADIVTISHEHLDHTYTDGVSGTPLVLDWPGQFESKSVRIWGISAFHDKSKGAERGSNILYRFEAEGISVLHCGDLGDVPDDTLLEEIGDVDVLMLPVGNKSSLSPADAAATIKKIEPSFVLPMHYGREGLVIEGLSPVTDFLKLMGIDALEPVEKLVIKKEDILADQATKIVLLSSA